VRLPVPLLPRWLRYGAVAAVAGFIFYTSIVTAPPETVVDQVRAGTGLEEAVQLDKWRHFVAYAVLGCTLAYAAADRELGPARSALLVVGVTVVYGVGIELGQSTIPDRYFSVGDALANALGGALALCWFGLERYVSYVPLGDFLDRVPHGGLLER
jgi:VanZ family protein